MVCKNLNHVWVVVVALKLKPDKLRTIRRIYVLSYKKATISYHYKDIILLKSN